MCKNLSGSERKALREEVERHIRNSMVVQRGNFTFCAISVKIAKQNYEGYGFAKYHAGDRMPYDTDLGVTIAYGKAIMDVMEQMVLAAEKTAMDQAQEAM